MSQLFSTWLHISYTITCVNVFNTVKVCVLKRSVIPPLFVTDVILSIYIYIEKQRQKDYIFVYTTHISNIYVKFYVFVVRLVRSIL